MGAFVFHVISVGASRIAIGDIGDRRTTEPDPFHTVHRRPLKDLTYSSGIGDNIYVGAVRGNRRRGEAWTIPIGEHGFIGACFIRWHLRCRLAVRRHRRWQWPTRVRPQPGVKFC